MSSLPLLALCASLATSGLAAGCTASRPDAPPAADAVVQPGDSVRVALGRSVRIGETTLRFASVVGDSRCPVDVSCVWAGEATVRIAAGGDSAVLTVPGGNPSEASAARLSGLTVRAVALTPYPGSAEARAGAAVEVTLVASAAASDGTP